MRRDRALCLFARRASKAGLVAALLLLWNAPASLADSESEENPFEPTGRSVEPEVPPEGVENTTPPSTATPDVALDELLKLPDGMSYQSQRRHGGSREAWRTRFRESQAEVDYARQELERIKQELDETAGGSGNQWQIAPPGSNQTEVAPVSFKLREEMRRTREQLDEAEKKQRALYIEADLAAVPQSWRENLN